jgi:hypothetical protein
MESVTSSSSRSSLSTARTPHATGGIVISEPCTPSHAACNTCLLPLKKVAGSSDMSSVRVKKEEANVPPPPRIQVKKEEDNTSLSSLKKKRHGREWLGPPNYAARQLQSRRRTIRRSSPTRGRQSVPPSTRSSRGPRNLPAPGLRQDAKKANPEHTPPRPLHQRRGRQRWPRLH